DIKIKDAIGRAWQCTTIQFDFNLPERFDMQYIGADNQAHRPYMIHRAILGSVERFFATLLEYHGGNLPLWLAPIQMMLLPITDAQLDYAKSLQDRMLSLGLRCEIDSRSEKIGYKIREAELKKIPYMCIIGKKEADAGTLTLRRHTKGDLGSMSINEAINIIKAEL
ncbi:MAG: threonine--tRNA ligase, partial [Candidatus Cloacimonetes bacterium]|nr:threonine--tRNA ligase [Candidatus Cloacimonadota bacterium]